MGMKGESPLVDVERRFGWSMLNLEPSWDKISERFLLRIGERRPLAGILVMEALANCILAESCETSRFTSAASERRAFARPWRNP